jgi:hypothetical protein
MAIQEMLYAGRVTDVKGLIEACRFPGDAYLLVEWQPKTIITDEEREKLLRFTWLKAKDVEGEEGVDIDSYTSGRVFHDDFELRWEWDAVEVGKASVVYLGVERELPAELKRKAAAESDEGVRQYYLFGERIEQEKQTLMSIEPPREHEYYAETRVPRLLLYPKVEGAERYKRLQVISREYRLTDPETGSEMGSAYRFLKLIGADWEEKKA